MTAGAGAFGGDRKHHARQRGGIDLGKQQNGGTYPPQWRLLFCFELSKRLEEGAALDP